jgi:pimeloyl-ACP methyl ester carboxylesterase
VATSRITTFEHDGLTFDVTDAGPLDGVPVLLLHGFPADRSSWGRVAPLLHEAGLRTFAPDQRGYSAGARPAGRAAYRLEHLVGDVTALVDATGHERVHLVGHDWGGAIAWLVAGNHPERVASMTSLSTPHPAALRRAARRLEQAARSWYIGAFQVPYVPEHVLAAAFRPIWSATGLPREDLERYAAHLAHADALSGPVNWYRAVRESHVRAWPVSVPVTLLWGSRDVALGRSAAELTRGFVTGPYAFIEIDAGHWLPETEPDACAAAAIDRIQSVS